MKRNHLRSIVPAAALAFAASFAVSCDPDFQEDPCGVAGGGGEIDPWRPGRDTTTKPQHDSIGGYEITLDKWGDTIRHDVAM